VISRRVEELSQVMDDIGPTQTTGNLWGERWSKLATNCMSNALAAITGLTSAELRQDSDVRALSVRIAAELTQVASALGVHVEPIGGIPAHMFHEALDDKGAMSEVQDLMIESAKTIGSGRPSLAQDVIKGRKTEVEHLNGYVVAQGRPIGVPTPVNQALVELTGRVEAGELDASLSNLEYVPS
jgi:2-dehydropantoate 2-reductase